MNLQEAPVYFISVIPYDDVVFIPEVATLLAAKHYLLVKYPDLFEIWSHRFRHSED